ncbi:hypothetical protein BJ508DRAFT_320185 [Ascobolus immersus RN42]|uniref:Uncharacterized protein n=1 Tax=Ascobolus immersus RN42 TaxID=1160509 RepID=A0A3N4ITM8_ASCIM|nr:hypothetical protein BJ508DRAFT_320185 [Ascobolus immersus RN42]
MRKEQHFHGFPSFDATSDTGLFASPPSSVSDVEQSLLDKQLTTGVLNTRESLTPEPLDVSKTDLNGSSKFEDVHHFMPMPQSAATWERPLFQLAIRENTRKRQRSPSLSAAVENLKLSEAAQADGDDGKEWYLAIKEKSTEDYTEDSKLVFTQSPSEVLKYATRLNGPNSAHSEQCRERKEFETRSVSSGKKSPFSCQGETTGCAEHFWIRRLEAKKDYFLRGTKQAKGKVVEVEWPVVGKKAVLATAKENYILYNASQRQQGLPPHDPPLVPRSIPESHPTKRARVSLVVRERPKHEPSEPIKKAPAVLAVRERPKPLSTPSFNCQYGENNEWLGISVQCPRVHGAIRQHEGVSYEWRLVLLPGQTNTSSTQAYGPRHRSIAPPPPGTLKGSVTQNSQYVVLQASAKAPGACEEKMILYQVWDITYYQRPLQRVVNRKYEMAGVDLKFAEKMALKWMVDYRAALGFHRTGVKISDTLCRAIISAPSTEALPSCECLKFLMACEALRERNSNKGTKKLYKHLDARADWQELMRKYKDRLWFSAPLASAPLASAPLASAPLASAPLASAPLASAPQAVWY